MTDQEKEATQAELETESKKEAPEEIPSPSVSHSEPAAVHSDRETPPLANDSAADSSNFQTQPGGHDEHDHAGGEETHSAGATDFGEVIGEKNWQDSFLSAVAVLVLCGFLWIGLVWSKLEPPNESASAGQVSGSSPMLDQHFPIHH